MLTGAIIGLLIASVLAFVNWRHARKGTGLAGQVDQAMRGQGVMSLEQIARAVGKDDRQGRGKVSWALSALTSAGKIRVIPAPEGTPLSKRGPLIRYEHLGK